MPGELIILQVVEIEIAGRLLKNKVLPRRTKNMMILAFGFVAGALAGWLYWQQAGCNGSCFIWSSPYRSSGYASLLGLLVAWNFLPGRSKKEK